MVTRMVSQHLHSSSYMYTAALVLITIAVSSSCPLGMSSECEQDSSSVTQEQIVEVGNKLVEYAIEEFEALFSEASETQSSGLNKTKFHDEVCPHFVNYSRFNLTLHLLSENDTRHDNVSLITFLMEKATLTSCEEVKSECSDEQGCADMNCSISSISTLCLSGSRRIIDCLSPNRTQCNMKSEGRDLMIQAWMRQNLSTKDLDDGVFHRLACLVESAIPIECTVPPDNGTVDQICCNEADF